MSLPELNDATIDELYKWLDKIPFSRPRKNVARDFSDGVLVAELVSYFLPKCIDLHNFAPASASVHKRYNWNTLNKKAFTRIGLQVPSHIVQQIIASKPGAVEFVLTNLRLKIDLALCEMARASVRTASRAASRNNSRNASQLSLNTIGSTSNISVDSISAPATPYNQRNKRYIGATGVGSHIPLSINGTTSCSTPSESVQTISGEHYVPANLLYEAKKEMLEKEEQMTKLEARIVHLNKLVELKEDRILQLTDRLEVLSREVFKQQNAQWNGYLNGDVKKNET